MSVLDEARGLEKRVLARLKELEPLVAEYQELSALAERLRSDGSGPSSTPAPRAAAPARTRPRSRGRSRPRVAVVSPGERTKQVHDLIAKRPGITVTQMGKELGVDPTGLYRIVRKLEADGEITKDGSALSPAGG